MPETDLLETKQKVGIFYEKVMQMRQELKKYRKIVNSQNLIIIPQKDVFSTGIMFDEFSSLVSEEQGQKIDGIGEWMKDNNSSVRIIAFSDNPTDRKTDWELRSRRSEAIQKILIEEHHIAPERITGPTPEAMGYGNRTECNAMIICILETK